MKNRVFFFIFVFVLIICSESKAEKDSTSVTLSAINETQGKDPTLKELLQALWSSFDIPFPDLLHKKYDSELDNATDGLSASVYPDIPFTRRNPLSLLGFRSQGEQTSNINLKFNLKYNPLSYWFIAATTVKYFKSSDKAQWDPDFTYTFGYEDWHPYTLSAVYSNYGGNRFRPDRSKGEKITKFEEGSIDVAYKFPGSELEEYLTLVHPAGSIEHSIHWDITPSFQDLESSSTKKWKHTLTFNTKYTIYKWLYFNFTLYCYPDHHQQPWNPDYTYGFGYLDWHPGTFSVQYNNYSGTRYPWRKQPSGTGRFRDGSFTVSFNWNFFN